jgi:ubiquinone/menaquinone biosynthesis methyltransferase
MTRGRARVAVAALAVFAAGVAHAADAPVYRVVEAFPHLEFNRPVDLEAPHDGSNRIFVVEQDGMIHVFKNRPDATIAEVFLDIRDRVNHDGNEMGLLGLAFHPRFEHTKEFFVDYTASKHTRRITRISRFHGGPYRNGADIASEDVVLEVGQPYANHNGGQIAFGPDGDLYVAFGDGGSAGDPNGNAQNRAVLLGKILRLDVSKRPYAIPADNPFRGNSRGWKEEIYAWGLRNPWRFSFDPPTGRMWAGDVGQSTWEEVDLIEAGKNYGWDCREGMHPYEAVVFVRRHQRLHRPGVGVWTRSGYLRDRRLRVSRPRACGPRGLLRVRRLWQRTRVGAPRRERRGGESTARRHRPVDLDAGRRRSGGTLPVRPRSQRPADAHLPAGDAVIDRDPDRHPRPVDEIVADRSRTPHMFTAIARRYDLLNHVLSLNVDRHWRRALVSSARARLDQSVLDVATGTADVAIEFARRTRVGRIVGLDPSPGMIEVGNEKLAAAGLADRIQLIEGDALALPFDDDAFDVVSIAFGLRNLPDFERGVSEMARVLKPGGRLVVLEFLPPRGAALVAYRIYLGAFLPVAGRIISGSREAYGYLAESIQGFMDQSEVRELLSGAGLRHVESRRLTGGIAALYRGVKS